MKTREMTRKQIALNDNDDLKHKLNEQTKLYQQEIKMITKKQEEIIKNQNEIHKYLKKQMSVFINIQKTHSWILEEIRNNNHEKRNGDQYCYENQDEDHTYEDNFIQTNDILTNEDQTNNGFKEEPMDMMLLNMKQKSRTCDLGDWDLLKKDH